MSTKAILYKIASCNNTGVTLQAINKASLIYLAWKEMLLPENICLLDNVQIFFLGTYYSHNMRNLNLAQILDKDYEIGSIKKIILAEVRSNAYLIMDVKTKKLETISLKFILDNTKLLNNFTSIQSFFLGARTGDMYDKTNFKFS